MDTIAMILSDKHTRALYLEGLTRTIAMEMAGIQARQEALSLTKGVSTKELRIMVGMKFEDPEFPLLQVLRKEKPATEYYEKLKQYRAKRGK